VMAIYTLLTWGTTVVGGPFVGWVCGRWSPRAGLGLAGAVTATAAALVVAFRRVRQRDAAPNASAAPTVPQTLPATLD
jgi:hypothetical protein